MATKVALAITGMHCASCAMNIDGDLEDTQGVKKAITSYAKQECEVEFDDQKVSLEELLRVIQQTGYQAEVKTNG